MVAWLLDHSPPNFEKGLILSSRSLNLPPTQSVYQSLANGLPLALRLPRDGLAEAHFRIPELGQKNGLGQVIYLEDLGFYDMISLSATTITPCYDLLLHLLGFWSTKFNTFIFSRGVVTPTLLDVTTIPGLPLEESMCMLTPTRGKLTMAMCTPKALTPSSSSRMQRQR